MGLKISRIPTDGVRDHLRKRTRLIEDLQVYLNKVDKLVAESETAHKGFRRAVEFFFPAEAPSHEVVTRLMHCMRVFEQARGDVQPLVDAAKKAFQTLLERAHHLERLMKERDKLSKKVEAYEKKLEKVRSKYSANPTPALTKRIAKMEERYTVVDRKFKKKDAETQLETINAMEGRYAEAATLISKSALIIIQYVLVLTPEMEKGHNLLAYLQPSAGVLQSTPAPPLTPTSSALRIYTPQHSDLQLRGGDSHGELSRNLHQPIQQASVALSFPDKIEVARQSGDRDLFKSAFQQVQPAAPSTMPSPDMSPHLRTTAEKEKAISVAPTVESSGQIGDSGNSQLNNPFDDDV